MIEFISFNIRSVLSISFEIDFSVHLQETHMNFIIAAANMRAFVYNLKGKYCTYYNEMYIGQGSGNSPGQF